MGQQSQLGVDALSLKQRFPKLRSSKVESVIKLAGDASTREYFRFVCDGSTYVLQRSEAFPGLNPGRHPFLAAQRILSSVGVPVPHVVAVDGDSGWVLLEDLGDQTLQQHMLPALYRKAMDLHLLWSSKVRAGDVSKWPEAPHFGWSFDFERLDFEMGWTELHLFDALLKRPDWGSQFRSMSAGNSRFLEARPRYFCHRDYHCRNIMVRRIPEQPSLELAVIDFQDARFGPISYDLVSLLWDPYVQMNRPLREELLGYWRERVAVCFGPAETQQILGSLDLELERMKLQRSLKAAGSYASFYVKKGRKDYLPSLGPALDSSLEALHRLKDRAQLLSGEDELLTLLERTRTATDRAILDL